MALLLAVAVAGCHSDAGSATPAVTAGSPSAVSSAGRVAAFDHIYVLVLENKPYASLIGSSDAPYLNSLARDYGVAANYAAVAHPSQPNYIALFSGSTNGVHTDGRYDLNAQNLADQLEAHGKTWMVYAQSYPGNCFTGDDSRATSDGPGARGSYARKHNPAISFTSISSNPARCGRIANLAAFDPNAANFELIVPNLCNDMHDCSVATGDAFLAAFVPAILNSPAFANSALFITTDEGADSGGGGGRVATVVVSPLARRGFVSQTAHDHYSLLRTIEEAWGLGCLAQSCSANDLGEFFGS